MQKKDFLNKEGLKYFYNGFKNIVDDIVTNKILEDNKKKYPIGKIIFSTEDTNPADYLGFGTWEAWGAGRVPVGVDVSQTDFNAPNKTGGEKTHKLTINEMPSHNHKPDRNGYGFMVYRTGASRPLLQTGRDRYGIVSKNQDDVNYANYVTNTGGGQAHNNLQPYITCYMWKRTA